MEHAVLRTEGMAVGYDRKILIQDITLSVAPGEILTLIGPNGAGKSTILKSITRRLELLGGRVLVEEALLRSMTERETARKISVMLTERPEPELMTCREVVESGRFPYTGRFGILSERDRDAVREAMETVRAEDLAEQSFLRISDGQRQRVLLARAICQEPEILVLDEPTSYLDIRHKLELLSLLRELARNKKAAVILSLHELDLAQRISDRVVCVRGDRIDRCGTPEEIFTGDYIARLYGVERGSFDGRCGSVELPRPEGAPRVFVIGGNGTGLPLFRQLQRMGIPFAAGILQENDIDCPAAGQLAAEVILSPAFEPVPEETEARAAELLLRCGAVLCGPERFGTLNRANERLAQLARKNGLLLPAENWQKELADRNIR